MCAIAGLLDVAGTLSQSAAQDAVHRMMTALAHRGPDAHGEISLWEDRLMLGHRRLSVVDLSVHANQPMRSGCGRYVVVANAEIYNHADLRKDCRHAGYAFSSHSDVEVLVACISLYGLEEALAQIRGMFAFACFDQQQHTLTLVRDAVGEKPLYVGSNNRHVVFASELNAFRALGDAWSFGINQRAVSEFLQFGYVTSPRCLLHNVVKLRPGCLLTLSPLQRELPAQVAWHTWPSIDPEPSGTRANQPTPRSSRVAVSQLESHLGAALTQQCAADVPVGVLLSGGIDSQAIARGLVTLGRTDLPAFTLRFEQSNYDEGQRAAQTADRYGLRHRMRTLTAPEGAALFRQFAESPNEPLGDPSVIASRAICELAREEVRVVLTGDGGDELFGGYSRYHHMRRLLPWISRWPTIRPGVCQFAVEHLPAALIDTLATRW